MVESTLLEISDRIISALPYGPSFHFVDEITEVNENGITGNYTFKPDHTFYRDHFVGHPITPGVILTECMAQIGLVCLGIFLRDFEMDGGNMRFAFTSADVDFLAPVFPGETVTVNSEKLFFKLGKLRCKTVLLKEDESVAVRGTLDGFIIRDDQK